MMTRHIIDLYFRIKSACEGLSELVDADELMDRVMMSIDNDVDWRSIVK